MNQLIPIINKLQDVFTAVGMQPVELPQLVVVGSQSSGKSSVLENIVGRDFLPRGTNIVTRRPLILQLINTRSDSTNYLTSNNTSNPLNYDDETDTSSTQPQDQTNKEKKIEETKDEKEQEWGEFLHKKDEKFYDFEAIRTEIQRETDRLTGSNKGVSSAPINLKICSPYVLNLTLVDLPGITKVPVGDQPSDIERQIRDMIWEYISSPTSIIVAVSPANLDIANSDALKLAKEADPNGIRTLCVITKIDLMDRGTDALDVLSGKVINLQHGFVGVINRSQMDINNKKPIAAALKSERQFFQQHAVYRSIATRLGTPYLAKRLNAILLNHIQECLPDIRLKIAHTIADTQQELESYGNSVLNSQTNLGPLLLHLLSKFCNNFCDALDGKSSEVSMSQLFGGARISYIFHEVFSRRLEQINPFDELSDQDIRTAIRNATGPRPSLFIPEISFELLVKRQIERLQPPSLQCVDLVFDELKKVASQCEILVPELQRFPNLREKLLECVRDLLESRLKPTKSMITNLIHIELAYINTNHPDFIGGSRAVSSLVDKILPNQKSFTSYPQIQSQPTKSEEIKTEYKTTATKKGQPQTLYMSMSQTLTQTDNFRGPSSFQTHNLQTTVSIPTDREIIETEIIKTLISSYFNIVRKNVQDSIPKAIMFFMVNHCKQDIQSELVRYIYKEQLFESLLKEADDISQKRNQCVDLLKIMRRALDIVNQVRDFNCLTTQT